MKILELFAGQQCFSKVAKSLGHQTFCSDIKNLDGIDYVIDIFDFDVEKVPFIPDFIWSSPDCATWSKAAGNLHFDKKSLKPKTEKAEKAFLMIDKTLEIINYYQNINPELIYYIENPAGRLRNYLMPNTIFEKVERLIVIDQCQYGRSEQKSTHLFTNDLYYKAKPRCKGLPFCHHSRNIKNIGSGIKKEYPVSNLRYYERAKIPIQLCQDILKQIKINY